MRVLVCGGRDFFDFRAVYAKLDALHSSRTIGVLIAGGAKGADTLAAEWAKFRGIPTHIFKADWKRDGKAAGPIRNQRMLDEGFPDLVVAFPGGTGTADMVRRARSAGIEVK